MASSTPSGKQFDRWCSNGIGEKIAKVLQDEELQGALEEIRIDSTSIKAHPVASTGRKAIDEKRRLAHASLPWTQHGGLTT